MMRKQARVEMTLVTIQPSLRSLQRSLEKKKTCQLQRYATNASGGKLLTNKTASLKRFPLSTMQGIYYVRTQSKVLVPRLCAAHTNAGPHAHLVRYRNAVASVLVLFTAT